MTGTGLPMLLSLLTTITLTLPLTDTAGQPLPPEPLVAVLYQTGSLGGPVAAKLGYPGEQLTMQTNRDYACWFASAWTIPSRLESAPSETVCKIDPNPPCQNCHQASL